MGYTLDEFCHLAVFNRQLSIRELDGMYSEGEFEVQLEEDIESPDFHELIVIHAQSAERLTPIRNIRASIPQPEHGAPHYEEDYNLWERQRYAEVTAMARAGDTPTAWSKDRCHHAAGHCKVCNISWHYYEFGIGHPWTKKHEKRVCEPNEFCTICNRVFTSSKHVHENSHKHMKARSKNDAILASKMNDMDSFYNRLRREEREPVPDLVETPSKRKKPTASQKSARCRYYALRTSAMCPLACAYTALNAPPWKCAIIACASTVAPLVKMRALKMMRVTKVMAHLQKSETRNFSVKAWGVRLRNQEAMP